MLAPKHGWLLVGLVTLAALACGALQFWQSWQRSHFNCQGEMEVFTADSHANITLRYIFSGDKGAIILRGVVNPENGEQQAINHNVWFSFTHKGDDYFLRSENITSNVGAKTSTKELVPVLPVFYQQSGEPFYLKIVRADGNNRLFFTSRVPSLLCKS